MTPGAARCVLLGAVLFAYARSPFGTFQYDDFNVLVHNAAVHDLGHWWGGLRPLLKLSYALNWAASPAPLGFLLLNLALHAVNALLVFELIRALLPEEEGSALLGALVFALHPVQTEAVAYVSGRSTSLMASFFLGGLWLSLRARVASASPWHLPAGLLCFGLAAATKETALVLPAVAGLVHGKVEGPARRRILGAFLALGAVLLLGLLLHPGYRRLFHFSFELRGCGAQLHGALAGLAYLFRVLLWPVGLNIDPPLAAPRGWTSEGLATALAVIVLTGLALVAWRHRPWVAVGIGWFLLTLLPTQGPVPRLDLANERHLYLPMAGVALLVAGLCRAPRLRRWAPAGTAAMSLLLGVGTTRRIGDYRTEVALWESSIRADPANARAHNNLGAALALAGRREEAREAFRKALRLRPDYALAEENLRGIE